MATMSKSHFEVIATTIRNATLDNPDSSSERYHWAYEFATALKRTNPLFDEDKFMEWCLRSDG